MEVSNKYYKYINVIKAIACIGIFLYHLDIFKGGYIFVCTFFVLSGYLACISAFKKEKFSFKDYYLSKLKRIYLPLIIVVLITIVVLSNNLWLNLKPEATSILLGYNNIWQVKTNIDYFTKNVCSPFMHLWFISILMQFYLVFPFVFIIFRKIGDKIHKLIPCILTLIISIGFTVFLYKYSLSNDIMTIYYNTFTRLFSLLFGVSLGFFDSYYVSTPNKLSNKPFNIILFTIYFLLLIGLGIYIDYNNLPIAFILILTTLLSTRLVAYSTTINNIKLPFIDKFIKFMSDISYEVYLIHYPVIYYFKDIDINNILKIIIIIVVTIILSSIMHYSITIKNTKGFINKVKCFICIIIAITTVYGGYLFYLAKDHTDEINALKKQLEQNELIIKQKQEEYKQQENKEQNDWNSMLTNLENEGNNLGDAVSNLSVVGVGDSIMLGAVSNLYNKFPNGYFDAKVSRTAWVLKGILNDLKSRNMLGNPVIFNLGANGDCSEALKSEIMGILENREVFWINVTNDSDVHVNAKLLQFSYKYDNLHVIDWYSISKGHGEYFGSDGIHLTTTGRVAYTNAIYDAIYNVYKKKYDEKKLALINEHNELQNNKMSFYGNSLLTNVIDDIKDNYTTANFITNTDYDYQLIKDDINTSISNNTLTHKLVFMFKDALTNKQYKELVELCNGHEIYIVSLNKDLTDDLKEYTNVHVIDFYKEIKEHDDYLFIDKVHLSDKGIKALKDLLINNIK